MPDPELEKIINVLRNGIYAKEESEQFKQFLEICDIIQSYIIIIKEWENTLEQNHLQKPKKKTTIVPHLQLFEDEEPTSR